MFGLTAFDSARASMEQSSYRLGMRDRETSVQIAAELVNFYQGNQRRYLEQHIDEVFSDAKLRTLYKSLIYFMNITALIVDRVAILGKRKAEIKFVNADGKPNEADQKLWDRIARKEIQHGGFDALLGAIGKYKELCKTVVVVPYWDPRSNRLRVRFYTPNMIDVAWDLRYGDPLDPKAYRILINDKQNRYRVFDFSDPAQGVVYEAIGQANDMQRQVSRDPETGAIVDDSVLAAKDPETGLTLDPFVAFRTVVPTTDYFVDDGQGQLAEGQRTINRLWTQEMGIMHHGAFQVPILEGPAWRRKENAPIQLSYDPSNGIAVPSLTGETVPSTIRWGGPANEGFIQKHLDVIARVTEGLVSTFHISPNEVIAKADAASGVSLFIGSSALKEKQQAATVLDEPSLIELVYKTTIIWNYHSPIEKGRFSLQSEVQVTIPQQPLSLDPLDELKHDALKVEEGFILREDVIRKYNPGITPEKLAAIKAQHELVTPPNINSLFRASTIGGPPAPAAPAPAAPAPAAKPAAATTPSRTMPPAGGGAPKPGGQKGA